MMPNFPFSVRSNINRPVQTVFNRSTTLSKALEKSQRLIEWEAETSLYWIKLLPDFHKTFTLFYYVGSCQNGLNTSSADVCSIFARHSLDSGRLNHGPKANLSWATTFSGLMGGRLYVSFLSNTGPHFVKGSYTSAWNYQEMFLATDGENENGLLLQNVRPTYSFYPRKIATKIQLCNANDATQPTSK